MQQEMLRVTPVIRQFVSVMVACGIMPGKTAARARAQGQGRFLSAKISQRSRLRRDKAIHFRISDAVIQVVLRARTVMVGTVTMIMRVMPGRNAPLRWIGQVERQADPRGDSIGTWEGPEVIVE